MDLREAANYFNISAQAMAEFTRKHLDEINTGGVHAIKIQGRWAYDGEAIKIIENMKKLPVSAMPDVEQLSEICADDNSDNKDLLLIVDSLQTKLTATMAELTQTALALVETERRNSNQQAELGTLRERVRAQAERIAQLEESEEKLKKKNLDALQYQADLKAERSHLQEKLNRERNRSWWKRIFSND